MAPPMVLGSPIRRGIYPGALIVSPRMGCGLSIGLDGSGVVTMDELDVELEALALSAGELRKVRKIFEYLAAALPEGTTVRRATAFVALAHLIARGGEVTLSQLAESVGCGEDGAPIFGTAPDRVLNQFRIPSPGKPAGLGWVSSETDLEDRRRKYLNLTLEGAKVARELADILRDG